MKPRKVKIAVGIIGCGAIGSRIAEGVVKELKKDCRLAGLYDIDRGKAGQLAKRLSARNVVQGSVGALIKRSDLVIEAVSARHTKDTIRQALNAGKDVLAMSVGKLLNATDLFRLAEKNKCRLLLPSGAIAGVDAVKAARLAGIDGITLTTRKPVKGFINNAHLEQKGIDLSRITRETVLFKGSVTEAVKHFPRNINVAATLALASGAGGKLTVRILTSPQFKTNSHEIALKGPFGTITTKTDNTVCPDNPKTSYLAVLSGLQTLRQYASGVFIGT